MNEPSILEGESEKIKIEVSHPSYSPEKILRSLNEIISPTPLVYLATVRGTTPYACIVVLSYDSNLCMFFFSDPKTEHVKNIEVNNQIAGEIANSNQTWESPRRGIQFRGVCRAATAKEVPWIIDHYNKRFPGFERHKTDSKHRKQSVHVRPYIIRPTWIKIFDELIFGKETWVEITLPEVCKLSH
jgi:uncharacterized protein YhbP (UPF0306 family)